MVVDLELLKGHSSYDVIHRAGWCRGKALDLYREAPISNLCPVISYPDEILVDSTLN
jgi:hypothetical protein